MVSVAHHARRSWGVTCLALFGILLFLGGTYYRTYSTRTSTQKLTTVINRLQTNLDEYFTTHYNAAYKLLTPDFVAMLAQNQQQRAEIEQRFTHIQKLTNIPWREFFFINAQGKLVITSRKQTKEVMNALTDLAEKVSVILMPLIGEYQPSREIPFLPMGFPVIHNKHYLGTFIIWIDPQPIEKFCTSSQHLLGTAGQLLIGHKAGKFGALLFASSPQKETSSNRFLLDEHPSFKDWKKIGTTDVVYDAHNNWKARAYTHFIRTGWMLSANQLLNRHYYFASSLQIIGIICLCLSMVLLMFFFIIAFNAWAHFFKKYAPTFFFAAISIGLITATCSFNWYWIKFTKTNKAEERKELSLTQSKIQLIASLLLQRTHQIQSFVHSLVLSLQSGKSTLGTWLNNGHTFEGQMTAIGMSYHTADTSQTHTKQWAHEYLIPNQGNSIKKNSTLAFINNVQTFTEKQWISSVQQPEFGSDSYTVFTEPFTTTHQGKHVSGIVWYALPYTAIQNIVTQLGTDQLKETFIIDHNGNIVFCSDKEYINNKAMIWDILRHPTSKPGILSGMQGYSGAFSFKNNHEPWHMIYEGLPGTQWTLMSFYPDNAFFFITQKIHTYQVLMVISLCLALIFALMLFFRIYVFDPTLLRWFGALYTCILLGGTLYLLAHNYRYLDSHYNAQGVTSKISTMQLQEQLEARLGTKPIPIPTGISIDFLDIANPNKVEFRATIWQTIDRSRYPDIKLGFEIVNKSSDLVIKEMAKTQEGPLEKIRYQVQGKIHQVEPNYRQYPFDMQPLSWYLSPIDTHTNVFLAADLGSYQHLDPNTKPGTSQSFDLQNYTIKKSYFSYTTDGDPELVFSVLLRRNFLAVTLEYFIPLLVILITIFLISLISFQMLSKQINIIASVSGLFFALILLHQKYRSTVVTSGFSYLEMFITIAYISLGYGYLDAIYLIGSPNLKIYKTTLYWPIIATYLFIITAFTFF